MLGIIHYFQNFRKITESSYARGRGKSSCTLSKMLALSTVPLHETSLANQHFYSTLLGRRERYVKRVATLCTLVKMLKIMDGPLAWIMMVNITV